MAFSQKVRFGNMMFGVAVGNSKSGRWAAASQVIVFFSEGSPVDRLTTRWLEEVLHDVGHH